MNLGDVIISFLGGMSAGVLNTLAGFGSIISLAIYMDMMGIPGHIANATNRINILASSSISSFTFYRNKMLDTSKNKWIIGVVLAGALLGAVMAARLDSDGFKSAFSYLLIPILIILLMNPRNFIRPDLDAKATSKWILVPILFILGFYAGFIQVGFGVIFLMVMVILGKYDLIKSNALKVVIVTVYTIVVLIYFHFQGLVHWSAGISLAAGQAFGGYFAAINASKMEGANKWAYRLLVLIVVVVIIKNFKLYTFFFNL